MMSVKKRGENFTNEEKNLMLKLTNKYKSIIENKRTDGSTWRSKEQTWKIIEKEFNSGNSGPVIKGIFINYKIYIYITLIYSYEQQNS